MPRRGCRAICWTTLSACLCLTAPEARAARTAVIAPLGALGISTAEARKVQRWLTAAALTLPDYRWLSSKRLARRLTGPRYYDCAERPVCVGNMARQIGAKLVVTGDIGSIGGAYIAYLRLTSASGSQLRSVSGVLRPGKDVRAAARELLYRLLLPSRYAGSLVVAADVDDAWVYLDGRRIARGRVAKIANVPVGTHAIRVAHENYHDFVQFVQVDFAKEAKVRAHLSAFPVHAQEMKLRERGEPLTSAELPWYRRWWAVAAFGAVVLAATATTVALIPKPVGRDTEATIAPP